MNAAAEKQEPEPTARELLDGTVWDIIRNAYVRAASGGRIPTSQVDRNALVRPFLQQMKQDHRALLACVEQGAILQYQEISAAAPPKPEDIEE